MELLDLDIEIVEDWYSVGNTKFDVGTLRFKDFICMVNFFWVTVTFGFSKSSRLRKICFRLGSMESCQKYP